MRIYISGPLQGSANLDEARRLYDLIARAVVEAGHVAYVPHHNTDPIAARFMSARNVFETDVNALGSADAVIAHVGLPSTGVGAEIALSIASARPVLALKRADEPSSRFAEGLVTDSGGAVAVFDDFDLDDLVVDWLNSLVANKYRFASPRPIQRHSIVA